MISQGSSLAASGQRGGRWRPRGARNQWICRLSLLGPGVALRAIATVAVRWRDLNGGASAPQGSPHRLRIFSDAAMESRRFQRDQPGMGNRFLAAVGGCSDHGQWR
jgi:hypothetical protein